MRRTYPLPNTKELHQSFSLWLWGWLVLFWWLKLRRPLRLNPRGRRSSCQDLVDATAVIILIIIDNALLLTFTCAIYFKSHKLRTFLSKFWFMRTILVLAADLLLLSYYIYHLVLHYEHVVLIHFLLCLVKTIFFTWHLKRQVSNDWTKLVKGGSIIIMINSSFFSASFGKWMNFRKISKEGSSKKVHCIFFFALEMTILVMNFQKKLQYIFSKKGAGRGGEGSKATRKFSENSSILEKTGLPSGRHP